MTPEQAGGLLAYGPLGLIVIVVLVILVPLVAAIVWHMRSSSRAFTDELAAARDERSETGARYERLVEAHTEGVRDQSNALRQLASALENRPCLTKNGPLLPREDQA